MNTNIRKKNICTTFKYMYVQNLDIKASNIHNIHIFTQPNNK